MALIFAPSLALPYPNSHSWFFFLPSFAFTSAFFQHFSHKNIYFQNGKHWVKSVAIVYHTVSLEWKNAILHSDSSISTLFAFFFSPVRNDSLPCLVVLFHFTLITSIYILLVDAQRQLVWLKINALVNIRKWNATWYSWCMHSPFMLVLVGSALYVRRSQKHAVWLCCVGERGWALEPPIDTNVKYYDRGSYV